MMEGELLFLHAEAAYKQFHLQQNEHRYPCLSYLDTGYDGKRDIMHIQTVEGVFQMEYGYERVSSRDQNEDRQMIAMSKARVPRKNIFVDRQSGKDFKRSGYQKLVRRLRPDDLLYIKSIDRLGRNYEEIQEQWRILTKVKKIDIVVLDMPLLDTRRGKDLLGAFLSDIVLQVLSFVAENERANIRQRQAEGIAAAKARGVQFGRPRKPTPANFDDVCRRWMRGELTGSAASAACRMPLTTFRRKAGNAQKNQVSQDLAV